MVFKNIWKHIKLYKKEKDSIGVGSSRDDARQVNIEIKQRHVYFAFTLFVVLIIGLYYGFIDNPNITSINQTLVCTDGTTEFLHDNKTVFCGVAYVNLTKIEKEVLEKWQ